MENKPIREYRKGEPVRCLTIRIEPAMLHELKRRAVNVSKFVREAIQEKLEKRA